MKIVLEGTVGEIKKFINQFENNGVLGHIERVYYPECLPFVTEKQKVQAVVLLRENYLSFEFVASSDFNNLEIKLFGNGFSFRKRRYSGRIEKLI